MTNRTIALLRKASDHPLTRHGRGARCVECGVVVMESPDGPDAWIADDGARTPQPPPCRLSIREGDVFVGFDGRDDAIEVERHVEAVFGPDDVNYREYRDGWLSSVSASFNGSFRRWVDKPTTRKLPEAEARTRVHLPDDVRRLPGSPDRPGA